MSVRPALHAVASGRVGEMGKVDVDIGFPSVEALDDIAVTTPTDTTEREITVSLPPGGSIVRATLIAYIVAMNNTANAQKIDVDVKGRKAGGTFSTFFSQDDCIGLVDVEGATVSLMTIQDVSAVVTEAGTYGFKVTITQSSANSVRYTTEYALIITYRRSVP